MVCSEVNCFSEERGVLSLRASGVNIVHLEETSTKGIFASFFGHQQLAMDNFLLTRSVLKPSISNYSLYSNFETATAYN